MLYQIKLKLLDASGHVKDKRCFKVKFIHLASETIFLYVLYTDKLFKLFAYQCLYMHIRNLTIRSIKLLLTA